jgi:hypothetical protein
VDAFSKGVTRICDEILSWREERERFLSGLQLETKDRKRVVFRMLARFSNDLAEIARRRRNVRMVFLLDLKQTAFRLRQETRDTLSVVRGAFSSFASTSPSAPARVRQNRQAATHARCQQPPRKKTEEVEPASSAVEASTKIVRGRRRKGVRHQHRP